MKINKFKLLVFLTILFSVVIMNGELKAQFENKWMNVGSLHNWYSEIGSEIEHGFVASQQYGLQWPAIYPYQDMQAAKAFWIGCKNFAEEDGTTFDFKVVHVGPRVTGVDEFFPVEFTVISKFDPGNVVVNGIDSYEKLVEIDEVDETMPFDRLMYNEVNTQIGITIKRRIYQFSADYHDDYIVQDYTFINTGNTDGDEEIERPGITLEDVVFHFQHRLAISRQTRYLVGNSSGWGVNTMLDARGEPGRADDDNPDGLRMQWAWHGYYSAFNEYNNIGVPVFHSGGQNYIGVADTVGRLGSAQFTGIISLFASKSPAEFDTDDAAQPSTTQYTSSDGTVAYNNSAWNASLMASEYSWMTKGHPEKRHAELIDGSSDYAVHATSTNDPGAGSGNNSGYSNAHGYGPYTLASGDSVRVIWVEAASGLSREEAIKVGMKFKEDFTNGVSSATEVKNLAVMTGKDSLIQTFKRVKNDFDADWNVPSAPLPPKDFVINSAGGRIDMSWDVHDNPGDINGFEIYRNATGNVPGYEDHEYFSKFELVATLGSEVREYSDTTASLNEDYYYYILSVGDEIAGNPGLNIPNHTLKSSRYYTQSFEPANALTPGEPSLTKKVRITPNPYIIDSGTLYGGSGNRNRLTFVNLPGVCTIKIYTELGELVKTIDHNDGSGAEKWFLNTNSNQILVSGIYIAVVHEAATGNQEIVKFVVIR
ncbi:MAG: hypothetical protein JEY94_13125 [Melioribacteraceae bacterium]|nr:hypothetical protein [Melioribacteraceae bacterium]